MEQRTKIGKQEIRNVRWKYRQGRQDEMQDRSREYWNKIQTRENKDSGTNEDVEWNTDRDRMVRQKMKMLDRPEQGDKM
jgi:hypothetical protein